MSDRTDIEWADATWNPIGGCSRVSEECRNCYAEVMAARFSDPGQWGHGLARRVKLRDGTTDHRWTGKLVLHEHKLDQPLRWKKPRRIFVNSTSDLFHENVPDEWIDRVFAVMALAPQHVFMVLTKRADRMREYFSARKEGDPWAEASDHIAELIGMEEATYVLEPRDIPLHNVWLGVSVGDQTAADERIPELLATPAAVRFVSAEPLLGPVDLARPTFGAIHCANRCADGCLAMGDEECARCLGGGEIDWVIVGGESGPGARPMHPDWAREIRDQCVAAGVSFFFKQWGAWGPYDRSRTDGALYATPYCMDSPMQNFGKKAAGRLLDGREWNEVPG